MDFFSIHDIRILLKHLYFNNYFIEQCFLFVFEKKNIYIYYYYII